MSGFWEQVLYIAIIAVSMVFGGYLYRKRHDDSQGRGGVATGKKKGSTHAASTAHAPKKRPRKKR